jgi:hypothetical protein
MYLGKDIFIVTLREPRVINGEWEEIDRTTDIFDLMDAYQQEQADHITILNDPL